jgi:hypothetical protein
MSPRARKVYLRRRLSLIESQIQLLSDELDADDSRRFPQRAWRPREFDEQRWTSLANLSYLLAARDALKLAIDVL